MTRFSYTSLFIATLLLANNVGAKGKLRGNGETTPESHVFDLLNDQNFIDPFGEVDIDAVIPVDDPSDSQEDGRLLFNLEADLAETLADDDEVDKSRVGGHFRESDDESAPSVESRIVGGSFSSNQQPWYGLTMQEIGGQFYRGPCGCALISSKWAVTAAHCLSNMRKNDLKGRITHVYVGAYKPWAVGANGKGNAGKSYEIIRVIRHIEHPLHVAGAGKPHDIALLELEANVSPSFTSFKPIALPSPGFENGLSSGTAGKVYGFGDTSYGGGNSKLLKEALVGYVPPSQCNQAMGRWGITDDMICFGGDGSKDACSGDSGGPLVVNNKLTGVVSWGYKCAEKGYPGVYASVEEHRSWILNYVPISTQQQRPTPPPTPRPTPSPVPKPTVEMKATCVNLYLGSVSYRKQGLKKTKRCLEILSKAKNLCKRTIWGTTKNEKVRDVCCEACDGF